MFDTAQVDQLTPRQRDVFDVVCRYLTQHGYPPTVREIGDELGLASSSTVHAHLGALEKAGLVRRDPTKPRALTLAGDPAELERDDGGHSERVELSAGPRSLSRSAGTGSVELPLVGSVAAGAPILAEEHIEEYVRVPEMLLRQGDSFVLRVRGDSMINAGIMDGDFVVVRRQPDAEDGQTVVALVDGESEATCKRLERRDNTVILHPENDAMQPIVPTHCEVLGTVTGVFRSI